MLPITANNNIRMIKIAGHFGKTKSITAINSSHE